MDKEAVAEVLEGAARLYRDEKVQWCSGAWIEVDTSGGEDQAYSHWTRDGEYESEGLALSACAEGALLRAAGYSWNEVARYTAPVEDDLLDRPEGKLFTEARLALARRIRAGTGKIRVSVHWWNDNLIGTIGDRKAKVIDAMEATAKDLRNG